MIEKIYHVKPTKEAQAAVRILKRFINYSEMFWVNGKLSIKCPRSEISFVERTLAPFM